MQADPRISKVDSEWDQDSESDPDFDQSYVTKQNTYPLYDVVPSEPLPLETIHSTSSQSQYLKNKTRKLKSTDKEFKSLRAKKTSSKLPIAFKLYVALLSFFLLLLAGWIFYITMKGNLFQPQRKTSPTNSSNHFSWVSEINQLKRKLNKTQNIMSKVQAQLEKGCPSGIQHLSVCYVFHLVSSIPQIVAEDKCSTLHENGLLAKVDSQQIEAILSYYLPTGGLWINGFRNTETSSYRFSDGGNFTSELIQNFADESGNCLSLVKQSNSSAIKVVNCNHSLKGFICQHSVSQN